MDTKKQEEINLVRLLFRQAAGQPLTATEISSRLDAIRAMYLLWWEHSLEHGADAYGPRSYRMITQITRLKEELKTESTVADSVEASAQFSLMLAKASNVDLSHLLEDDTDAAEC